MIAKILIVILCLPLVGLIAFFCWKADQMMQEELEREKLRKATQAALRYDKHMERLKKAGMRANYRRARVW